MNKHCFRLIFSKRLGSLVAVGEHITSHDQSASETTTKSLTKDPSNLSFTDSYVGFLKSIYAAATLTGVLMSQHSWALTPSAPAPNTLPTAPQLTSGSATVATSGNTMSISQSSSQSIINWGSFSIGSSASVNIQQPSSQSVLLNRVVGSDPSQIFGKLSANGQILLINPNGIVFGSTGSVTATSFTASTLDIADSDFLNGHYKFSRNNACGAIIVQNGAVIQTQQGGYVALMGAQVDNEGMITTQGGQAILAAGEAITLVSVPLSAKVHLDISPSTLNTLVQNSGSGVIVTQGGQVLMQASSIATAVACVTQSGLIDTSSAQAGAVQILSDGGNVKVNGTILANNFLASNNSSNDNSTIVIGRNPFTGNLSKLTDVSNATLSSHNGSIETSGETLITDQVTISANHWLLDPTDVVITTSTQSGITGNTTLSPNTVGSTISYVNNLTLSNSLSAGTNITITTTNANGTGNGDITVNAAIAVNASAGSSPTLTLQATRNINVNANITETGSGKLNLLFNSDTGGACGSIQVWNSTIATNGGNIIMGGGTAGNASGAAVGIPTGAIVYIAGTNNGATNRTGVSIQNSTLNAGGGNITATGLGVSNQSSGYGYGNGIEVGCSTITTNGTGVITLNGTGGPSGNGYNYGLMISSSTISNVDGNISLTGTAGAATGSNNLGIYAASSTNITTTGQGSIFLYGYGNATASGYGSGVWLASSTKLSATGTGSITLTGYDLSGYNGPGVLLDNGAMVNVSGANITVNANVFGLSDGDFPSLPWSSGGIGTLNAGAGTVSIRPYTNSVNLNIGAINSNGYLGLSSSALSQITANTVNFGSTAVTGNFSVGSAISASSLANISNLKVYTNGSATVANNVSLANTSLLIQANGGITTNVSVLENSTGASNISFLTAGSNASITIGGCITETGTGFVNINVSSSNLGTTTINSNLTTNGGNITLNNGTGAVIVNNTNLNAGTGNITMNGTAVATGGYGVFLNASNITANGIFVYANSTPNSTAADGAHIMSSNLTAQSTGINITGISSAATGICGVYASSSYFVSQNGNISISGTATGPSSNAVRFDAAVINTTGTGNISIIGTTGVNDTTSASSVVLASGTTISALASGNISITSIDNTIAKVSNNIKLAGVAVSANNGTITLNTDYINYTSGSLNAGTNGTINILPQTSSTSLVLNSNGSNGVSGNLGLSSGLLSCTTANALNFGNSTSTGAFSVASAVSETTLSNISNLNVYTNGTATIGNNIALANTNLLINANSGITESSAITENATAVLNSIKLISNGSVSITNSITEVGTGQLNVSAQTLCGTVAMTGASIITGGGDILANGTLVNLNSYTLNASGGNIALVGNNLTAYSGENAGSTYYGAINLNASSISTTGSGNITVTGLIPAFATANTQMGVQLWNTSIVASNGNILLNGTTLSSTGTGYVTGLVFQSGSSVKTIGSGNIIINANAPNTVNGSTVSALFLSASTIQANGSGNISITTVEPGWGVSFPGLGVMTGSSIAANNGTINLTTDYFSLASGTTINAGTSGTINLVNLSNSTALNLGGNNAYGTLGVTASALGQMTANTLNFGNNSTTGSFSVGAVINNTNLTNISNLNVYTNGSATIGNTVNLPNTNFTVNANSGITLTQAIFSNATSNTTIALLSNSGSVNLNNTIQANGTGTSTINISGANGIISNASEIIVSNFANISSTKGNIGQSSQYINITASNITANSNGSQYINSNFSGNIGLTACATNGSVVINATAGSLVVSNITANGAGSCISLTAAGNITVNSSVGSPSTALNVSLVANGFVSGSGTITTRNGNLTISSGANSTLAGTINSGTGTVSILNPNATGSYVSLTTSPSWSSTAGIISIGSNATLYLNYSGNYLANGSIASQVQESSNSNLLLGAGTWLLNNSTNTFGSNASITTAASGRLNIIAQGQVGSNSNGWANLVNSLAYSTGSGNSINAGEFFIYTPTANTSLTLNNNFTLLGVNDGTFGAIRLNPQAANTSITLGGNITLAGFTRIAYMGGATLPEYITGNISGTGNTLELYSNSLGSFYITGASNSYGNTIIDGGNGVVTVGYNSNVGSLGTGAVTIYGGSSLTFNSTSSTPTLITGPITNSGTINIAGTNTVIFTGTNNATYPSGTGVTNISSGTLQIGNGGNTGAIGATGTVTISSGATLALNQNSSLAITNAIAGAGNVLQCGTGTTTLSGTLTYSGNTSVTSGSLVVSSVLNAGNYSGNISITGATSCLTLQSATNQTIAGTISGNGTLNLPSTATVSLTGNVSGFNGTTSLNNGTLKFAGTSDQTINTNISGNGTLAANVSGNLTLNSNISLASSPNAMSLTAGNITLSAGSLTSNSGKNIILNATSGSVSGSGSIVASTLFLNGSSIGSSATPINATASCVSINSAGSAYVTDSIAATFDACTSGNVWIADSAGLTVGSDTTKTVNAANITGINTNSNATVTLKSDKAITLNNTVNAGTGGTVQIAGVNVTNIDIGGNIPSSCTTTLEVNASSNLAQNITAKTLQIGDGNTSNITISGNFSVGSNLTNLIVQGINISQNGTGGVLVASNEIDFLNSGNMGSSSAAILVSSGNVTINASGAGSQYLSNNQSFNFAAQTGSGNLSVTNTAGNLSIGTVNGLTGVNSTGNISLSSVGNINLSQCVSTTSNTSAALILNAGSNVAAGNNTGGNILVSGSGNVSMGSGGTALLYTGSVANSTGVAALTTSGSYRYDSNASATNFTANTTNGTFVIYRERPNITITLNNATKTYDGAAYSGGNGTSYSGFINGDSNSSISGNISYSGTSQSALNVGNYTLNGSGLSNSLGYNLVYANATLSVTPKTITANFTASNKTYDGTTNATANGTLSGVVSGDAGNVTVTDTAATFASANAANNITVNVTGLALTGSAAGNYVLQNNTAQSAANITQKTITANFTTTSKTYDGTTTANVTGNLSGVISNDASNVTVTDTAANYVSANAGSNISVNVTGLGLTGSAAGNYVLQNTTVQSIGSISQKTITVNFSASNKTYDGTTTANVTGNLTGVISGDAANVTVSSTTANFATANVGTNISVNVTGATLSGSASGNYVLQNTTGQSAANITQKIITANFSTANKTYDGTTTANVTGNLSGLVSADAGNVTVTDTAANFATANAGSNISVNVTGLALSGSASGNYVLQNASVLSSGNIGQKTITANFTTTNKTYDGTTTANVTGNLSGVFSGDTANVTVTDTAANFATANAGSNISVNVTGLGLNGSAAGNYILQNTTALSSGNIGQKTITVNFTALNKTYDGTTTANISSNLSGLVSSDTSNVTVTNSIANFATANAGNNITVNVTGATLSGSASGNYILQNSAGQSAANITQKTITANFTTSGKTYDGTTTANVTGNLSGVVSTDAGNVTVTDTAANFATANAGSNISVNVTGLALSGSASGNYVLQNASVLSSGNIGQKTITANFTTSNKTYDGTTTANVSGNLSGVISADAANVSVTDTAANFVSTNAGSNISVNVTGLGLTGSAAGNYVLQNTTALSSGNIGQKTITASFTAQNKTYDGSTAANVTGNLSGVISSDSSYVCVSGSSATFATANAGNNISVNVTGAALSGFASGNYILQNTTAQTSANITQKSITANFTAQNKTYDGTTIANVTGTLNGAISGDNVNVTSACSTFASSNVGSNLNVNISSLSLTGTSAGNYLLTTTSSTSSASITPALLTVTLQGSVSKTYDGTNAATLSSSNYNISGWIGSQGGSVSQTAGVYNSPNVSDNTSSSKGLVTTNLFNSSFTANNGTLLSNYLLPSTANGSIGIITPACLTIKVNDTAVFVTQNATTAADQGFTYTGLVPTDSAATALAGGALTASNRVYLGNTNAPNTYTPAAGNYTGVFGINTTPTAAHSNYNITIQSGNLTVVAADKLLITISSQSAAYGNITTSTSSALAANGTITAQYCLVAGNCTGTNVASLNVTALSNNQWQASDNTGNSVTFTAGSTGATYSQGNYLNAGNYGYTASQITTASTNNNFNGSFVNGGVLTVNPLNVSITTSTITKTYDGTINVQGSSLTLNGKLSNDVVSATSALGNYASANVSNNIAYNISGLSLTGSDANNYALRTTALSGLGNITVKTLTASNLSIVTKTYDGTTNATVIGSLSGVVGTDDVNITTVSASFASANAGNNVSATISGLALIGNSSSNYALQSSTAQTTGTITQKIITANFTALNKTYDGNTSASVIGNVSGLIGLDSVNVTSNAANFASSNVGNNITVSISGMTLTGASAGNYQLQNTTAQSSANITQKSITASFVTANKTYDGNTTANVTGYLVGVVGSDNVNVTSSTANFSSANVANNITVNVTGLALTGVAANNYLLVNTTSQTTGNITPKSIAASFTASDKTYDGSTAANVTGCLSGLIGSDSVNVTNAAANFTSANAGNNISINVTGLGLTGSSAGNYVLINTTSQTVANISQKVITASFTGNNKTYDGSTNATVSGCLSGLVGADSVNVTSTANFVSANAANNVTINVSSLALTGAASGNYQLQNSTAQTSANITPKMITANFSTSTKTYDGATTANVTGNLSGVMSADTANVTVTESAANFTSINAGNNISVNVTGVSLCGSAAGNYVLQNTTVMSIGNITQKLLTANFTASDKTYDGTASTTACGTVIGTIGSDNVNITSSAANFVTTNAGNNITVNVTGLALTGSAANNYMLQSNSSLSIANITQKTLTVSFGNTTKTYDGTTSANVTGCLSGIVGSDSVNVTNTANFANANVASNLVVSVANISLTGAASNNYVLQNTTALTSGNITPKTITANFVTTNKTYDGVTTANVSGNLSGVIGSDNVNITNTSADFASANAGNNISVAIVGLNLTGAAANNYVLQTTQASSIGNITKKSITASFTTTDKTYDGSTVASVAGNLSGIIGTDSINVSNSGANFVSANAGSNITVNVNGLTLSGTAANNYVLQTTSTQSIGNISQKSITASFTTNNKTYDGSMNATVMGALSGVVGSDNVTVTNASASFNSSNAGTNIGVNISGFGLTGSAAGNYQLQNTSAVSTGNITPKSITANFVASNKTYDGTTAANVTGALSGIIGSDSVNVTSSSANFASADVASHIAVNITGLSLTGSSASNYALANASATSSANITPATLSIALQGTVTKTYDGQRTANLSSSNYLITGWVGSDGGSVTQTSGLYASANVSDNMANAQGLVSTNVYYTNIAATGTTKLSNYRMSSSVSGNVGIITPASLTIKVNDSSIFVTQNATNAVDQGFSFTGLVPTDSAASVLNGGALTASNRTYLGSSNTPVAGTYSGVFGLNATPTAVNGNYNITVINGNLTVVPADKLLITVNSQSSIYGSFAVGSANVAANGTVSAAYCLSAGNCTGSNVAALNVTALSNNQWKATDSTGDYVVFSTGLNAPTYSQGGYLNVGNYVYTTSQISPLSINGNFNGRSTNSGVLTVTPLNVSVSTTGAIKTYDGTLQVLNATTNVQGLLSGDTVNGNYGLGTYSNKNSSSQISYTLSGLSLNGSDSSNYAISNSTATGIGAITPKTLTLSNVTVSNKTYDGTTYASITSSGVICGLVDGETLSINSQSASFSNPQVSSTTQVNINTVLSNGDNGGLSSNYVLPAVTLYASILPTPTPTPTPPNNPNGNGGGNNSSTNNQPTPYPTPNFSNNNYFSNNSSTTTYAKITGVSGQENSNYSSASIPPQVTPLECLPTNSSTCECMSSGASDPEVMLCYESNSYK